MVGVEGRHVNSTNAGRASRSACACACESWIGSESSRALHRISVGAVRSAALAVQSEERIGMRPGGPTRRASGWMVSLGTARWAACCGEPKPAAGAVGLDDFGPVEGWGFDYERGDQSLMSRVAGELESDSATH